MVSTAKLDTDLDDYLKQFKDLPHSERIELLYYMPRFEKLTELPAELKPTLLHFDCQVNKLTKLPDVLPKNLRTFRCNTNMITVLPELPEKLLELICFNNLLSELPHLPNSLIHVDCHENPIVFITPENYITMKHIYLNTVSSVNTVFIFKTIFYDNSGCKNCDEFFGKC